MILDRQDLSILRCALRQYAEDLKKCQQTPQIRRDRERCEEMVRELLNFDDAEVRRLT